MKQLKPLLVLLLALLTLSGARCGGIAATRPAVEQAVIATSIHYDNQPDNNIEQVPTSTAVIYLAAEVTDPTSATTVQVTWYQLPNQVIATETFAGKRQSSSNQLDFDYQKSASWLASRVERPGLSWPMGEYRAEVRLGSQLAKTVFFKVVSDIAAEEASAKKIIRSVKFGDTLNDSNQLSSSKTSFRRTAPAIYIQVELAGAKPGTDLQVGVRYVKDDLLINTFSSVVMGDDQLVFALSRDRFGKLWSDQLWPVGSFQVTAKVNGVAAWTGSFLVQS